MPRPTKFDHPNPVSVHLERRNVELLDDLAREQQVTRSDLIRRGIRRVLREEMFGEERNGDD